MAQIKHLFLEDLKAYSWKHIGMSKTNHATTNPLIYSNVARFVNIGVDRYYILCFPHLSNVIL